MLSQIEPGDNGIGTAVVTENRCNGFIKSPTYIPMSVYPNHLLLGFGVDLGSD